MIKLIILTHSYKAQVVEYVIDLAAALWQAVPFAGHQGTGDLQDIIVSTKDMVRACHRQHPPAPGSRRFFNLADHDRGLIAAA